MQWTFSGCGLYNHKSHKGPYITHPHMWDIVKNWIKEKGELKGSVIEFVQKKFLVATNVDVVLIPLQVANH